MNWYEGLKLVGASLFSVIPPGTLIVGLASWIGIVWAKRILQSEIHNLKLQQAQTQNALDTSLEKSKRELDFLKETRSSIHNDKIVIYRKIIDIVAKLLASLDAHHSGRLNLSEKHFDQFNEQRMKVYGYLGMFAPQSVMDAHDRLIDHLILISYDKKTYIWSEVRELVLHFMNEVRKDVGIDKTSIRYLGQL